MHNWAIFLLSLTGLFRGVQKVPKLDISRCNPNCVQFWAKVPNVGYSKRALPVEWNYHNHEPCTKRYKVVRQSVSRFITLPPSENTLKEWSWTLVTFQTFDRSDEATFPNCIFPNCIFPNCNFQTLFFKQFFQTLFFQTVFLQTLFFQTVFLKTVFFRTVYFLTIFLQTVFLQTIFVQTEFFLKFIILNCIFQSECIL